MSGKHLKISDLARIAIATARAAAGEFSGLAAEGVRHSRNLIPIVITIVLGVLLLFTTLIYAASKQIPGFEMLYEIGSRINPPSIENPEINISTENKAPTTIPEETVEGGSQ